MLEWLIIILIVWVVICFVLDSLNEPLRDLERRIEKLERSSFD